MAVAPTPNQIDLTLAVGERSTSNPWFYADEVSPEGDYLSDLRADLSMFRSSDRTRWSLRYSPF